MTVMAMRPTNGSGNECDGGAIAGSAGGSDSRVLYDAIDTIASFVGSFEPSRYSGDDAALLVTTFTRAERLCGAAKTLAATRVAESNRHVLSGDRSAAEWLAKETGGSVGEAVDLLQLGQTLESQPEVEQAYRDGKLSASRAKLVANAARPTRGERANWSMGRRRTRCDNSRSGACGPRLRAAHRRKLPERRRPSAKHAGVGPGRTLTELSASMRY